MKFFGLLYAASVLLGSFCPMTMTSAMQMTQTIDHDSYSQEVFMSPNLPMTFAAPMSVAAIVFNYTPPPIAQALSSCPDGNCIMTHHANKQDIAVPAVTHLQKLAAFPATVYSLADTLSLPSPPSTPARGFHIADIIATVVLRT